MTSFGEQVSSLAADAKRWADAGFPLTSDLELLERAARCDRCPKYERLPLGIGRCLDCGCFSVKRQMETAQCPQDLWGGLEPLKPGVLLYKFKDAITDYYAARQTVFTIQPATDIALRVALSGLARPASRMGKYFAADPMLQSTNPLAVWDPIPDAGKMTGCGHIIQRLCRGNGITPDKRPRGCIVNEQKRVKCRVAFDGDAATKKMIDPALDLVAVPDSLQEAIKTLATAEWFIGQPGDKMHVAAALGLRSIIVVDNPVYLPQLVAIGDGTEWLYPQNVHLCRFGSTFLTPTLSAKSITDAMAGDVYPFWTDAYLGMAPA